MQSQEEKKKNLINNNSKIGLQLWSVADPDTLRETKIEF